MYVWTKGRKDVQWKDEPTMDDTGIFDERTDWQKNLGTDCRDGWVESMHSQVDMHQTEIPEGNYYSVTSMEQLMNERMTKQNNWMYI